MKDKRNKIHKLFLVVDGKEDSYPSYDTASLSISINDPIKFDGHQFGIFSPIFTPFKNGVDMIETILNKRVAFYYVSNLHPILKVIISEFGLEGSNQIYYSLGLANIIVIDDHQNTLIDDINSLIKNESKDNFFAYEEWITDENGKIEQKEAKVFASFEPKSIDIDVSEYLSTDINFVISEFTISANKILAGSKRFSPHYFEFFKRIFGVVKLLIDDLKFLFSDPKATPSDDLLERFQNQFEIERSLSFEETLNIIRSNLPSVTVDQINSIKNEKLGRLIQFSSSISYVYNQSFCGAVPILDHVGIIRRHSLLGLGHAMNGLKELLLQMEIAFANIPFEEVDLKKENRTNTIWGGVKLYNDIPFSLDSLINSFFPEMHSQIVWEKEAEKSNTFQTLSNSRDHLEKNDTGFFMRMPFFSGRLGFREYELSVACALQTLVSSSSLKWHIINYTHEIIHGHVRVILNKLIRPREIDISYEKWIEKNIDGVYEINRKLISARAIQKSDLDKLIDTNYDFFVYIIFNYCIKAKALGSLSKSWDLVKNKSYKADTRLGRPLHAPSPSEFEEDWKDHHYRDISEMFVHVLDYKYVYCEQLNDYLVAIWTSWSTMPIVQAKTKHYVLRTLLIIALKEKKANPSIRFESSLLSLSTLVSKSENIEDFALPKEFIQSVINQDKDSRDMKDLEERFKNCIVVVDMFYQFFSVDFQEFIKNGDTKFNRDRIFKDTDGNENYYSIEFLGLAESEVHSKVGFVFDLLTRLIRGKESIDEEYESAWIFSILGSYNIK
ncbi:hypothetical protein [Ekhidna sp. To15]|uniref:hypothetical protein n=1 Tax=Ekhidna sp. To15 TaxID=3395267 RepID=UPI003F5233EA